MLEITETALEAIGKHLEGENDYLRVFVQGGGCSGFQYGFQLEDIMNDDDFIIEKGKIKVLVDSISISYLQNATIDYIEDDMGSQFNIKNPNAQSSCGCGSSFSV
jgi:iron-sulfur cluster insertion protein